MAFTRPTLTEISNRIKADIIANVTGADTLLRRSVLMVFAKTIAGAIHLLYGFLVLQAKNLFAITASTDGLENIGSEYRVTRKAASYATGQTVATGTNGIVILSGSKLRLSDGRTYSVDDDAVVATGTATLTVTATEAGEDGDENGGVILTFINPIPGVNSQTTVTTGGLIGGADEESDDDYRQRILTRKRYPPHGGADFDFKAQVLEYSADITRSWCIPEYQGLGTVGITFVLDEQVGSIIPNSTLVSAVREYLVSHTDVVTSKTVGVYVTAEPGMFVFAPEPLAVDFTIQVSPNTSLVQTAITTELDAFIRREGGPAQTLYRSRISEAISIAVDEAEHILVAPASDITASTTQVQVLGTVTYSDYPV